MDLIYRFWKTLLNICFAGCITVSVANAGEFPRRFILNVDADQHRTTMDFAPADRDMQWRVLVKCVKNTKINQYWGQAELKDHYLSGKFDGRKSQTFKFDKNVMLLIFSRGFCSGGKATMTLGLSE